MVSFNNCSGSHSTNSALSASDINACDDELQSFYGNSVRAYVNKTNSCASCHNDAGASISKFASENLGTAYSQFKDIGMERMQAVAVDPTHATGISGGQHQEPFNNLTYFWERAIQKNITCKSNEPLSDGSLVGRGQVAESIYFGTVTETLTWNLLDAKDVIEGVNVPAVFQVDVAVNYETIEGAQVATGYRFSNPRAFALVGDFQINLEGIYFMAGNRVMADLVDFSAISQTIKGVNTTVLAAQTDIGYSSQLSNFDEIQVFIRRASSTLRTDNPPVPPDPAITLAGGAMFTNNATVNVAIANDATAVRWCLTHINERPATTNDPCPGVEAIPGRINGWAVARPTNFNFNLVSSPVLGDNLQLYLWVANSDLKISEGSPNDGVLFDNVRPDPSVIASLTVNTDPMTGSQVANINITSPPDVIQWCIEEGVTADNNAGGCVFMSEKPTVIGLKAGGTRVVTVFGRDAAGNNSNASVAVSVANPFGQINYAQLTATDGSARAIFKNTCALCHSSAGSNPTALAAMDIMDYAAVVARKTQIKARIYDSANPMPATGLMAERERALIKLWIDQTTIPAQ